MTNANLILIILLFNSVFLGIFKRYKSLTFFIFFEFLVSLGFVYDYAFVMKGDDLPFTIQYIMNFLYDIFPVIVWMFFIYCVVIVLLQLLQEKLRQDIDIDK